MNLKFKFKQAFIYFSLVTLMFLNLQTQVYGKIINVSNVSEFRQALSQAEPGTTILLAPGNYGNQIQIMRLHGTPGKRITIAGADKSDLPLFEGGSSALHLVACRYITLRNIKVVGSTGNGINADHGGSHLTPSTGMVFENIVIEDVGPKGNRDALKLSGLYSFKVRNCTFSGWGGSAIDMVGCLDGIIENCLFAGKDGFSQDNAVQTKGASERIIVRLNTFRNAGQRAVNIGGSTGIQFFRHDSLDYEAKDIEVTGNYFIGGISPVNFVSSTQCRVMYNTIIHPEKWVIRILQEMPVDRFQPCNKGVFENNLIVFDKKVNDFINVGGNTQPETFILKGNAWYSSDIDRLPVLPVKEIEGIYKVNPELASTGTGLFEVRSTNPQILAVGAHAYIKEIKSHKNNTGIASLYPGDKGIENHPSVVFTEKFSADSLGEVLRNWSGNMGGKDHRLSLDALVGPDGNTGKSLKMTILRNIGGDGSELKKILDQGYEQLYFRFYVKFAKDYGFNHHFSTMSGDMNPTPWHVGRAGLKPTEHYSTTIDLYTHSVNEMPPASPPGNWFFYSYWPEMRSWQTEEGNTDGRPNPYYGNNFIPYEPVSSKRGEWQCVEIMIRLNSSPDKSDGAHAFWIDGKLAGHWDPLEDEPVKGYWIRENFRHNPGHQNAKPFTGIKWRTYDDMEKFEKFKINIVKLQNYVSETSWGRADKYAANNPGFLINLKEATVWKDNIVVATEYIGPLPGKK